MFKIQSMVALALLSAMVGCGSAPQLAAPHQPVLVSPVNTQAVRVQDQDSGLDAKWYKAGAFMEINVRAFADGDGDGVGDLKGLIGRLDYLKALGITGLWLMPITESSEHDHGYTTRDYRKVETEYGTQADLVELVAQAHKRGIGIILDYVMNHSDSRNPLFQYAKSGKYPQYRDWYIWQNSAPSGWVNLSGGSPWSTTPTGVYYSMFWWRMPDFNLRNEEVVEYHKNNLRYWLNLGVDGFRFDAVSTLIESGPGLKQQLNQPESYALMREMRTVINDYQKRYLVCEDPGWEVSTGSQSACASAFAISSTGLNYQMRALASGHLSFLEAVAHYPLGKSGRVATVLANHDLFAGRRVMDELNGDETAYKLAAATYLTMSGIPFVYYGEEIGQRQMPVTDPTSDWPQRGPMSWSSTPEVTQSTVIGPYGNYYQPAPNQASHNVAQERGDAQSLLNFYTKLLNLRKSSPALRLGDYRVLKVTSKSSIIERRLNDESVIVAINYSNTSETTPLTGLDPNLHYLSALAFNASTRDWPTLGGAASLTLPARSIQIYRSPLADQAVYKGADLFIRGTMNDWEPSPSTQLRYVSAGIYEQTLNLTEASTYYFKISTSDWSDYHFGGVVAADQTGRSAHARLGAKTELEPVGWHNTGGAGDDIQLDIRKPGLYLFRLDARDALNPSLEVLPRT